MYIFLPCVICIFHWFKETLKGVCQWKIEYKINCYLYIGKRFQLSFSWFTWRDVFRRSHRGSLGLLCVWIVEERTSLPKANYLEASKESSICNRTKTEFSFPIYVPSKREREGSQADGVKLVTESLTFFRHYACDLIVLECAALVTSQRWTKEAHAFVHVRQIFELSPTRICTCVCMSVYIIVFTTANVNTMQVYRGPCGASLFSVWMGTVFMKRKLQRAGTKGSLCDVQLIKGLQLSGNESQNLFRPVRTDTLASLLPFSFSFWITL